jgi:hypothetical protein
MAKKFANIDEANNAITKRLKEAVELIRDAEEIAKHNKVSFDLTINQFVKGTFHGSIVDREYVDEGWTQR